MHLAEVAGSKPAPVLFLENVMKKKMSPKPRAGSIPRVAPVKSTSRPVMATKSYRELKGKPAC